jgi:ribosomal protein S24E
MKLEQIYEKEEKIQGRKSYIFTGEEKTITPSTEVIKGLVATLTKSKPELVIITKIQTTYGSSKIKVFAQTYSDEKSYKLFGPTHIVSPKKKKGAN